MDNDSQLQAKIIAALRVTLGENRIGVTASGGNVTLSGFAKSITEKQAADRIVRAIQGVGAIFDRLTIDCRREGGCEVEAVQKFLREIEPLIGPEECVDVLVENGAAQLSGILDWPESLAAVNDAAARTLPPLRVETDIAVRNPVSRADIGNRLRDAFERAGCRRGEPINVVVEGRTVRLGGRVDHWRERTLAERAALAAPGVVTVENGIIVG